MANPKTLAKLLRKGPDGKSKPREKNPRGLEKKFPKSKPSSPKAVRITCSILQDFTNLNLSEMKMELGFGALLIIPESEMRKITPWKRKYKGARKALFALVCDPEEFRILITCEGRKKGSKVEWRTVSASFIRHASK